MTTYYLTYEQIVENLLLAASGLTYSGTTGSGITMSYVDFGFNYELGLNDEIVGHNWSYPAFFLTPTDTSIGENSEMVYTFTITLVGQPLDSLADRTSIYSQFVDWSVAYLQQLDREIIIAYDSNLSPFDVNYDAKLVGWTFDITVNSIYDCVLTSNYVYSGATGVSGGYLFSGTSGVDGSSGTSGTSAPGLTSGTSGSSGTDGASGVGTSGTSGSSGVDGTIGTSGADGTSGVDGLSGATGVDGTPGTSGTSGIDGGGLSGGTSGTSGSSGIDGTSGVDGLSGSTGVDGTSGSSGIDGVDGTSGSSGIDGLSGSTGADGTSGSSGIDGTSGSSGIDGLSGSTGADGTSGIDGTSGVDGLSGSTGADGTSGSSGVDGTSGVDGLSGSTGVDGTSGSSGIDGTSGSSGIDGTSGTSGSSGLDGLTGSTTDSDFFYDTSTDTLYTPQIVMTGTTDFVTHPSNYLSLFIDEDTGEVYANSGATGNISITGSTEGEMLYWNDTSKEWLIASTGITWDETNNYINLSAILYDTTFTSTNVEGLVHWDDDSGTMEIGMKGGTVRLQTGLEHLIRARNETGSLIPNGTPVYISGASGTKATIGVANATIHIVASSTIAVTTEDIADSSYGYSTILGDVNGVDTSGLIAGRPVFLDVVSGFTGTLPTAPNSKVFIGVVIVSHATDGKIFVKTISNPNIDELSNVHISGITTGDILQYNVDRWENISGFTDGTSGTSGSSGIDGTSGTSGSSGIDGTSGTSGSSGIDGTSGTSGIDGFTGATIDDDFYYLPGTDTLHTKNIWVSGSTVSEGNVYNYTKTITASHTGLTNEHTVFLDGSSAGLSYYLPASANAYVNGVGRFLQLKRVDSSPANKVYVVANGTELIDDSISQELLTYESFTLTTNGTKWFII